jgi:hypothetical protein
MMLHVRNVKDYIDAVQEICSLAKDLPFYASPAATAWTSRMGILCPESERHEDVRGED